MINETANEAEEGRSLQALQEKCLSCQNCALAATRTKVVFGVGVSDAEVLFIGEGPGENEDLSGEPFVGRGGILLDKFLAAIDLSREKNIYIANMVKCRPPQNRNPSPLEMASCSAYLQNQIALLKPKIIVCLGRVPSCALIEKDYKVTKQHGEWTVKNEIAIMGTFHPAALLRNPNNKPAAFQDMLSLQKKIQELCTHTYSL